MESVSDPIVSEPLLGLRELGRLIGVSVYRLREAAKDGRLPVTYDTRVAFGRLVPRATRIAAETYKRRYYGKNAQMGPTAKSTTTAACQRAS
jgi:hypothetical protein